MKILIESTEYDRMKHVANMKHVACLRGARIRNASMCPCGMHTTTQQQPECRNLTRFEVSHEKAQEGIQTAP